MHGPDKRDYPNECVFIKIEKPRLIAWDHVSNPQFQVVMSLEKVGKEKTKVTFKMVFESQEACAR
jgi:hypothetical protein